MDRHPLRSAHATVTTNPLAELVYRSKVVLQYAADHPPTTTTIEPTTTPTTVIGTAVQASSAPVATSGGERTIGEGVPCDGDLPPCWRVEIESHGTWNAYNPGGCSGTGCFGPFQFGGFWAGKLGLPLNLFDTTHDQWVTAARILWDHGRGCSNWSAC